MRLLVVGGGHASLPLLAHARELCAEVTLLSDRPDLWYSGMTPEWLGGVYSRADVTVPLDRICADQGVRFVEGAAVGLDRSAREVTTGGGERVPYDLVAFDVGAVNPGDADGAIHTKPLHRVEALGRFLDAAAQDPSGPRRLVVVGGGAAGVETALNVTARPDLPALRVVVLEPGERLVSSLPERVGAWAACVLRERGADVRLGARVEQSDAGGVRLARGERIGADAVLWATGSVGPDWLGAAGLSVTDKGLVRVGPGLRSVDDARVFVAGDAAAVAGHEGLARIGVHAVKQGPTLRENVGRVARALGRGGAPDAVDLEPWRPYPAAPLVLSTGGRAAWYAVGPLALKGGAFLRLKHGVDRRWIDQYRAPDTYRHRWDDRAAIDGPVDSLRGAGRG
ncbi:FAD-dependent oxidoreductase [Rubrivirga sp. S365]